MNIILKLVNEAYNYLDKGNTDDAEKILKKIKTFKMTPEIKFSMSSLLIEIGTESNKMNYIDEGIKNFEELKKETQYFVDYNLANGYSSKYKLSIEKPNYLTKDEHLLHKAKKLYINNIKIMPLEQYDLNYINLGNTYDYIGRTIDALECYEKAPHHPYSLINKGIGLYEYSKFSENATPILKDAYDCFKTILNIQNIPLDFKIKSESYMKDIETICGDNLLKKINKPLEKPLKDNFESEIVNFCLEKKLYLNLCNFCQRCNNAIGDNITLPNMIVKIKDSIGNNPYIKLSSQLNQIKMDYASSRFLLILSQTSKINLELISQNMVLIDTLSYEDTDIKVQLLKNSFTNFYNILDKISHLINQYFDLNKNPNKLNFHNVWDNRHGNINGKLRSLNNIGLSALYDIHLELGNKNEKFYLRTMRNNMTHNFLKVKLIKTKDNDLTFEELLKKTIELATLVKNAIIYLMRSIYINEQIKQKKLKNKNIPTINHNMQKL